MNRGARLRQCYENLAKIRGHAVESLEVVETVERHRRYWRPKSPAVILLAESHVHTIRSELLPLQHLPTEIASSDIPKEFVRLVYCLGYGERELTPRSLRTNSPTWQFWKILYSCVHQVLDNNDCSPILVSKTQREERLINKYNLLATLKDQGIWLVDASIIALYKSGGIDPKPRGRPYREIILTSWQGYVSAIIKEANPRFVICVGTGVDDVLHDSLRAMMGNNYTVFPQPQARGYSHLAWAGKYWNICQQYACKI